MIASLPVIAGMIYQRSFLNQTSDAIAALAYDPSLDWSANLAKLIGVSSPEAFDMMRMYMTIHTDHEGGNVSAHATHLVRSKKKRAHISLS